MAVPRRSAPKSIIVRHAREHHRVTRAPPGGYARKHCDLIRWNGNLLCFKPLLSPPSPRGKIPRRHQRAAPWLCKNIPACGCWQRSFGKFTIADGCSVDKVCDVAIVLFAGVQELENLLRRNCHPVAKIIVLCG